MNPPDLATQLAFTFEDLAANRAGMLTPAQRTRLRGVLLRETIIYSIFALVPLIVLLILFDNPYINPLILLVLALIALAFVLYVVGLQRSTRADLTARVSVASGPIDLRDVGRGLYRLVIGKQSFEVSHEVFASFVNGQSYHIYFTPNLKTIVSAESTESSV
ncbi:MAG TPA: hypothetical protein VHD90_14115 [Phototrophicaceae bacterium]|nr:hypothetical protein [Phototrophicaceae bacterium]